VAKSFEARQRIQQEEKQDEQARKEDKGSIQWFF